MCIYVYIYNNGIEREQNRIDRARATALRKLGNRCGNLTQNTLVIAVGANMDVRNGFTRCLCFGLHVFDGQELLWELKVYHRHYCLRFGAKRKDAHRDLESA